MRRCSILAAVVVTGGCASGQPQEIDRDRVDAAHPRPIDAAAGSIDAAGGSIDAAEVDASEVDAAVPDAAVIDAMVAKPDAKPGTPDAKPVPDAAPAPDGGTVGGVLFANSQTELYKIDVATHAIAKVGAFGWPSVVGNDAMADIAIAPDGAVIGASSAHLYRCDAVTAACTHLGALAHSLNALAYVPKGAIDPSAEVLVGASMDGALYRIDATTGAMTSLGHFSGGHASSGDLAYAGTSLIAAVNPGGTNDSLAKVGLPGGATTAIGTTALPWLWGLASAGGTLYGFTLSREVVTIDPVTGAATHVATGPADWYGAAGR
jgi:hypothetical protein